MYDSVLRVFTELKAIQQLDPVVPHVIDTGLTFSFILLGGPCKIYFLFFPASDSILRLVGPSLGFC